jgi:hypothetical protein
MVRNTCRGFCVVASVVEIDQEHAPNLALQDGKVSPYTVCIQHC